MLPAQSNQYESELKIFESCSGTLRQSLERVFFFTTAKKISADTKLSEKKMSQSRDEYAAVYDFLDNILGTYYLIDCLDCWTNQKICNIMIASPMQRNFKVKLKN